MEMHQIRYFPALSEYLNFRRAAGFGVTFLPEFSVVTPGVLSRPLIKPEVIREISLVSIEGRTWSPAVETFTRAVQTYPWHDARLQKGA
jgi:hypothetical protein